MGAMKRAARWMLGGVVCVSLVGCVAVAGIWGWSYWRTFELKQFEYHGERVRLFVHRGRVGVDNDPQVQRETRKAREQARRFDEEREAMLNQSILEERAWKARVEREQIYV